MDNCSSKSQPSYLVPPVAAPKRSGNMSLCVKVHGSYDEKAFEEKIYLKCVDRDWWIELEAYLKLLCDLGAADISDQRSDVDVPHMIARLYSDTPKDLPANPGVSFPSHRGTLGEVDYSPLRFVRVGVEVQSSFRRLAELWHAENSAEYQSTLSSIKSVPSYSRDSFESKFGLIWY